MQPHVQFIHQRLSKIKDQKKLKNRLDQNTYKFQGTTLHRFVLLLYSKKLNAALI